MKNKQIVSLSLSSECLERVDVVIKTMFPQMYNYISRSSRIEMIVDYMYLTYCKKGGETDDSV